MRFLIVLDPLARLDLSGDTSYALMLEICRRGHELWTCEAGDLSLEHEDPVAFARMTHATVADTPAAAFSTDEPTPIPLEAFTAVLMRADPPVDVAYLHATWILEQARAKTVLVNDPRSLRELNEHLAVLRFPDLTPPTVVTRSTARLDAFVDEQGGAMVVKPVDGFGGLGVFVARRGDPNLSSILETATAQGTRWTMAQRYLPEATAGDKRILLVEGEPIGALLRVPAKTEARGNLHVGARAERVDIDDADRAIIRQLAPVLAEFGLLFVGIDVIGGYLTEINITSPTGIRHIDALYGTNLAAAVIDAIEAKAR